MEGGSNERACAKTPPGASLVATALATGHNRGKAPRQEQPPTLLGYMGPPERDSRLMRRKYSDWSWKIKKKPPDGPLGSNASFVRCPPARPSIHSFEFVARSLCPFIIACKDFWVETGNCQTDKLPFFCTVLGRHSAAAPPLDHYHHQPPTTNH